MYGILTLIGVFASLVIIISSLKMREPFVQKIGYVAAFVSVLAFGSCCLAFVSSGHVGVPVVFGKVNIGANLSEGINVVNPFAEIYKKSIRTENYTMSKVADQGEVQGDDSIEGLSSEGLKMSLDVTVAFRQVGADAGWVHRTFGPKWRDVLVRSPSRTAVREAQATFLAVESFSAKREKLAKEIEEKLIARIQKLIKDRCDGETVRVVIQVVDVQLRQVSLPSDMTDAIEDKLVAQQEEEKMVFVINKEKKEKERMGIEGDAISEYNGKIEKSLTTNVLNYKAIEAMKLLSMSPNSKVYVIGGGEGGMPLIMNDSVK
jgi:regulator of protease activity HflC (stomatin/prohibitin superfamily)